VGAAKGGEEVVVVEEEAVVWVGLRFFFAFAPSASLGRVFSALAVITGPHDGGAEHLYRRETREREGQPTFPLLRLGSSYDVEKLFLVALVLIFELDLCKLGGTCVLLHFVCARMRDKH